MMNQNQQAMSLPIDRKMLLSIREAAEYSNIGINKIDEMLKQPNCPFVLYVGTKKLVKRKALRNLSKVGLQFNNQRHWNWCAPKTPKSIEKNTFLC